MRKLTALVAFVCTSFLIGCGGGAVKVVKLSDVDEALAKYEGDAKFDPFSGGEEGAAQGEEWVVTYGAVCPMAEEGADALPCPPELEKYENLFKDAAVLLATVKQTRWILQGIDEGKFTAADVKPLIEFSLRKLPALAEDGQKLVADAQSLNPANDLAAHPFKIGAVVGGIAEMIGTVGSAVAEIPELLAALGGLVS